MNNEDHIISNDIIAEALKNSDIGHNVQIHDFETYTTKIYNDMVEKGIPLLPAWTTDFIHTPMTEPTLAIIVNQPLFSAFSDKDQKRIAGLAVDTIARMIAEPSKEHPIDINMEDAGILSRLSITTTFLIQCFKFGFANRMNPYRRTTGRNAGPSLVFNK